MELSRATVFCPGHISGYFRPVADESSSCQGSIGAGLVISEGVRVTAVKSSIPSVKVFQTDRYGVPVLISESSPVIMDLMSFMQVNASVETNCHLPVGSGYGMSAAAILGTVHALNTLYNLNLTPRECAWIAHNTEVLHKSGLGDVSACQGGGYVIRHSPGPDGEIVRGMDLRPVYALTMGPIKTSSVLSSPDMADRISGAYPETSPKNLDEIMRLSREFAEKSGLIPDEIRPVLSACDDRKIPASMTMLGCGVFAIGKEAEPVLKRFGRVYRLAISPGGPVILSGERSS